ncbi:MAG TPA: hypothetical protein VFQ53_04555 [Kofleriaceae bacterium]|nr:hypothetical protein [Kofleriaceae bacterium]
MTKVAIDASAIHVVTDEDARRIVSESLGRDGDWSSELMKYRMTSSWQDDWVVEVGNWLARARTLGFEDHVLRPINGQRSADGSRDASDPVHRNVTQRLFHAMVAHYFAGIGWRFIASEPNHSLLRRDGTPADIDLQFEAPDGTHVDFQVKASGTLGVHEHVVDARILESVAHAADQLPDPAPGPSIIVVGGQRGWPLSGDIDVLEELIGPTAQYPDGTLLLHENEFGSLAQWDHVSTVIALDYRRGLSDFDYGCTVLLNPWAYQRSEPSWFPHSRVLECCDNVFRWHRGHPESSTFRGACIAPPRI